MANLEAISYINLGDGNHPIDAVTVGGKTVPDVSNFITKSVNDLTNYYLKTETYTKSEVEDLIGAILQFHYEIAASTSAVTSPESNVLYLIGPTGDGADKYEEYVYPNSTTGWTKIGDTTIDLSGYVSIEMLNDTLEDYMTSSEIEEMELVIAGSLNDLNERLVYIEESVFPGVSNQLYNVENSISSLDSRVSTLETNASSYLTSESDPVFSASPASSITNANISSWNAKQNALVYDSVPTANSSNMVKSGDLYTVIVENEEVTAAALINLDGRVQTLESNTLTSESDPIYSASVAATITASDISSWNAKQDALVYDSVPTENSDNLVKSGALYSVITHNEYVVATAINDLNDRLEVVESSPASAVTASDIANWNSTASTLSNYVTTSDYDDDQEVIATAMNDLNDRVSDLEESTESDPVFMSSVAASITASDISNWNSTASALSNYVTMSDLIDDEEVISTAINDLNDRLEVVESSPASAVTASDIANWNSMASSLSNYVTISDLEDDEYVIAQTLNNLNDRVTTLESNNGVSSSETDPVFSASVAASISAADISNWNSKTSNTGTLTGVTFNGVSASVSGDVASLSVTLDSITDGSSRKLKMPLWVDQNTSWSVLVSAYDNYDLIFMEFGDATYGYSNQLALRCTDRTMYNSNTGYHFTGSLYSPDEEKYFITNVILGEGSNDSLTMLSFYHETIPSAVTESTVSGWGFTKNTGTVTGSSLTADKIVLGNGSSAIKTSTYGITTTAPSSGSTNDTIPTSSAIYSAIDTALTTVLKYKGTIGTGGTVTSLPASHKVGDVYVVSVSGTYAGKSCEVGDYIICNTAGTSANNAHWDVVTGENQVSNSAASLATAGNSATIATVDGTNITISTPSTWTGVDKTGTITGISMNGSSKGTSGNVDLGTVITAVSFNGTAATISNGVASITASIPAEVTEATVSGWGFTKNTGTLTTHASHKLTTTNGTATSGSNTITYVESLTGTTTATSGDLSLTATRKTVTIPTVNNVSISIQKNGTTVGTFTTNATTASTINLSINELPSVSSADNGKVLQVVNGSWTLVSPATIISGSGTPSNSTGNDGDLYLQTS